jgi:hypothetical protein
MRVYFTTTVAMAEVVWRDGWTDLFHEFGKDGVYLITAPFTAISGFEGEVTLCLDVPEQLFDRFDVTDGVQKECGYRMALVPAAELKQLGKPQVYDHLYAGCSRRELLESIRTWESQEDEGSRRRAVEMRQALQFFDRIGWLTPLRLREQGQASEAE